MTPESKTGFPFALACAQCEEHLADLLDGTLAPELKTQVEAHLAACQVCAGFARDVAGALAFAERTASVEVPATLVPQILAEITTGPSRVLVETSLAERVFGQWIRPVLQPRFALGLAMAALSVAMIPWRDVSPASARILTTAENRVVRIYDRALKGYEDSVVLAEASNQLAEWRAADEQSVTNGASSGDPSGDGGAQPR